MSRTPKWPFGEIKCGANYTHKVTGTVSDRGTSKDSARLGKASKNGSADFVLPLRKLRHTNKNTSGLHMEAESCGGTLSSPRHWHQHPWPC